MSLIARKCKSLRFAAMRAPPFSNMTGILAPRRSINGQAAVRRAWLARKALRRAAATLSDALLEIPNCVSLSATDGIKRTSAALGSMAALASDHCRQAMAASPPSLMTTRSSSHVGSAGRANLTSLCKAHPHVRQILAVQRGWRRECPAPGDFKDIADLSIQAFQGPTSRCQRLAQSANQMIGVAEHRDKHERSIQCQPRHIRRKKHLNGSLSDARADLLDVCVTPAPHSVGQ